MPERSPNPSESPQAHQAPEETTAPEIAQGEIIPGRGRGAYSPHQIPWRGWLDVLWRVAKAVGDDNLGLLAGGVAFFAILSLVPAIIAIISLYGLVVNPDQAQGHIENLAGVLPYSARMVLMDQVQSLVSKASQTLGWSALLATLGALLSASSATVKMMVAIGIAYDEPDERSYLRLRWQALLLTLGLMLAGVFALGLIALPAALNRLELHPWLEGALLHGRWVAQGLLAMGGLSIVYGVAPDRTNARWQWVTWGSLVTTVLWVLASMVFSMYVESFGSFGETYGALAGVIVLMLWTFISVYVVLIGAELNGELEAQTAVDSTVGPPKPMGARNARKADVLGDLRR